LQRRDLLDRVVEDAVSEDEVHTQDEPRGKTFEDATAQRRTSDGVGRTWDVKCDDSHADGLGRSADRCERGRVGLDGVFEKLKGTTVD
jgi:hypothetical protein